MPLRIGRYSEGAREEHKQLLKAAVAGLGSDAAAILPESMRIEFEQVGNVGGAKDLFLHLAEWLDRQTSKAVLGQTMTTDDGSSQSQANIHNEVRLDILKSDARQLEVTLNRDLIKPFIDLNFGPQAVYPRLVLHVDVETEDLKTAGRESIDAGAPGTESLGVCDQRQVRPARPERGGGVAECAIPSSGDGRQSAARLEPRAGRCA